MEYHLLGIYFSKLSPVHCVFVDVCKICRHPKKMSDPKSHNYDYAKFIGINSTLVLPDKAQPSGTTYKVSTETQTHLEVFGTEICTCGSKGITVVGESKIETSLSVTGNDAKIKFPIAIQCEECKFIIASIGYCHFMKSELLCSTSNWNRDHKCVDADLYWECPYCLKNLCCAFCHSKHVKYKHKKTDRSLIQLTTIGGNRCRLCKKESPCDKLVARKFKTAEELYLAITNPTGTEVFSYRSIVCENCSEFAKRALRGDFAYKPKIGFNYGDTYLIPPDVIVPEGTYLPFLIGGSVPFIALLDSHEMKLRQTHAEYNFPILCNVRSIELFEPLEFMSMFQSTMDVSWGIRFGTHFVCGICDPKCLFGEPLLVKIEEEIIRRNKLIRKQIEYCDLPPVLTNIIGDFVLSIDYFPNAIDTIASILRPIHNDIRKHYDGVMKALTMSVSP
ncbi:MAG: hypothetical protein Edafosvirus1_104 [Edafosvirus sp.]|uniref:Uncharacterized protein n=1 Tax=Edafosvirus sp. TaxID=2487765 RepID=A0A3G4ZVX8_9VIRU|nr:MAG: hypothetical protein Edafosvirus1_104 [Edafosvirus sp.]